MKKAIISLVLASTAVCSTAYAQSGSEVISDPFIQSVQHSTFHKWKFGELVPQGYHVETRYRWPLIAVGLGVFATSYASSVWYVATNLSPSTTWLGMPVIGPFADVLSCHVIPTCKFSPDDQLLLVIDGLSQVTGVTMFLSGIAFKKHILVPNVSAMIVPSSNGIQLVGSF